MIVAIGSRSEPKIIGITKAFSRYSELWLKDNDNIEYIIIPKDIQKEENKGQELDEFSGVSCNPMSLTESITGAKNRSKSAFDYAINKKGKCSYAVGIESGLYPVNELKTGYMLNSVCSIYDGEEYYIGFSPSFECPQEAIDRVLKGEELGLMHNIFVNAKGRNGVIGTMSKERMYRDEFEELSTMMALVHVINK